MVHLNPPSGDVIFIQLLSGIKSDVLVAAINRAQSNRGSRRTLTVEKRTDRFFSMRGA